MEHILIIGFERIGSVLRVDNGTWKEGLFFRMISAKEKLVPKQYLSKELWQLLETDLMAIIFWCSDFEGF